MTTEDDEATVEPLPEARADPADVDLPAGVGRHRSPGPSVRVSPGRAGARSLWLVGLAAALALVAWTWLDRPRVDPVPAAARGVDRRVDHDAGRGGRRDVLDRGRLSVVGLVARPGLVTLPSGARVADAIEAAGGLLPEADPASVNLAAVVADGQQIAVGVPGAPAPGAACGGAPPAAAGGR